MLKKIKAIISKKKSSLDGYDWLREIDPTKRLQIATCALFIEMANADEQFLDIEKAKVIELMANLFNINEDYIQELLELSKRSVEDSLSLYEFTSEVNANSNQDEKYEIVKNLWRLIFVDDELHPYEDYLIRKISSSLHVSHSDMMAAKKEIENSLN